MAKIKVKNVLFNILAIITAVAVLFVGFNLLTSTKGYAVTSDSMADTLNRGDVVFSRKTEFESLKVGDVITVRVGQSGFFTHRIVDIDTENKTVTTRGDANTANDPMSTEADRIVGKMIYSVPLLGFVSIFTSGNSTLILIILIITAAVLIAVNTILSKTKKTRGDNNE